MARIDIQSEFRSSSILALIASLVLSLVGCDGDSLNSSVQSSITTGFLVTTLKPSQLKPSETLTIVGVGFTNEIKLTIDGQDFTEFQRNSDKEITLGLPDGPPGIILVAIGKNNESTSLQILRLPKDDLPMLFGSAPESICAGQTFYSKDGKLATGTRQCLETCTSAGQIDCLVSSDFPPMDAVTPKPKACSQDGETECLSSAAFPAVDLDLLSTEKLPKIQSEVVIAGQSGTLKTCTEDGQNECVVSAMYRAANTANFSANDIKTGVTVGGVLGNLSGVSPQCNADGEVGCLTTVGFPSVEKAYITLNKSKFHSSITIAATAGLMSDCLEDGSGCYLPAYATGPQNKKAIDFSKLDKDKMLNTLTISGVTGTIANKGTWDLRLAFPGAGIYTGISNPPAAANYRSGTNILATNGTIANCANDASGCFIETYDGTTYKMKAIDIPDLDASKMLTSLTIGGKTGTVDNKGIWDLRLAFPGPGIYTGISNPPAAADYRSGTNVLATNGAIANCANDASGCFIEIYDGTTYKMKAIDIQALDADKMLTSLNIGGKAGNIVGRGTWNLTATYPGDGYFTGVSNYPAVSDIKNAISILGITGNYGGGVLPSCAADGATSCIAGTNYPAADIASKAVPTNIRRGISIAGIPGEYTGGGEYIVVTEPSSFNDKINVNDSFNITFSAFDANTEDQDVYLYYKLNSSTGCSGDPTAAGNNWTQITTGSLNESSTSYNWDTTGLPLGYYYICAQYTANITQYFTSTSALAIGIDGSCVAADGVTWRNMEGGCAYFNGPTVTVFSAATSPKNWNNANTYCQGLNQGGKNDWNLESAFRLEAAAYGSGPSQIVNMELNGVYWGHSISAFYAFNTEMSLVEPGVASREKINNHYVICTRSP